MSNGNASMVRRGTAVSLLLLVIFLAGWEWGPGLLRIPPFIIPPLSAVASEAVRMWHVSGLLMHTGITAGEVRARITAAADRWMAGKDAKFGAAGIRHMQRMIVLHALDELWREHLLTLNDLRRAIGWRGYARRQPLTEYRTEAFHLFESMLRRLATAVTALSMRVGILPR